jgi:hypothetical protein
VRRDGDRGARGEASGRRRQDVKESLGTV